MTDHEFEAGRRPEVYEGTVKSLNGKEKIGII